tara:strand:- start:257 stop:781 length:525 start_codon:yes stop_codon:yes gene_type:complete
VRSPPDKGLSVSELVTVGRIGAVFGTRGWLRVHSYTRPASNLLDYSPWFIGEQHEKLDVVDSRVHHGSSIVQLDGVTDRTHAATYVRCDIAVKRDLFPRDDPSAFYWLDLIGMEVENQDGSVLGTVSTMHETGGNDVMEIGGGRNVLIPFVSGVYVLSVDTRARRIFVDWPDDD